MTVPEDMFAGVVGVAPSHERLEVFRRREEALEASGQPVADPLPEAAIPPEAADGLRTIPPRETGGNLDVRQLVAGSKLWLPVDVPGALFSIGDLHFAQGDGEVCGTGDRGRRRRDRALRAASRRCARRFPTFETPARPGRRSFATMGIPVDEGMDLNAATRAALLEMIDHLERTYGFDRPAAYALCSVAVDLRVSEVVDVPYPVVSALLRLDVFDEARVESPVGQIRTVPAPSGRDETARPEQASAWHRRCAEPVTSASSGPLLAVLVDSPATRGATCTETTPATRFTNASIMPATSGVSTSPPSVTSPPETSTCRVSGGTAKVPRTTSSRISRAMSSSVRRNARTRSARVTMPASFASVDHRQALDLPLDHQRGGLGDRAVDADRERRRRHRLAGRPRRELRTDARRRCRRGSERSRPRAGGRAPASFSTMSDSETTPTTAPAASTTGSPEMRSSPRSTATSFREVAGLDRPPRSSSSRL